MSYSPRQTLAFPEVAKIHKGTPKIEMTDRNNKKFFGLGSDLKKSFRISFIKGAESAKEAFMALHGDSYVKYDYNYRKPGVYADPDGFEMDVIRTRVPCGNVFDAFTWANEAYNGGTRIAVADENHYISYKNPLNTSEYLVSNGMPFKEFKHGDEIKYQKDGREVVLPIRSNLRLSLFVPEIKRFVYFTLQSRSIYDYWQIQAHLSGIQMYANVLNNGVAAGIPLLIYRKEQEVTWNKKDGTSVQTKHWIINIEADPLWVESAMDRIGRLSIGEDIRPMLNAPLNPITLTGEENPELPDDDVDGDLAGEEPTALTVPAPVVDVEPRLTGYSIKQTELLVAEKLAQNEHNAKNMLVLSELPFDATDEDIKKWGVAYRKYRDQKIIPAPTAIEAADYANKHYLD